jgi:hypothetical protein
MVVVRESFRDPTPKPTADDTLNRATRLAGLYGPDWGNQRPTDSRPATHPGGKPPRVLRTNRRRLRSHHPRGPPISPTSDDRQPLLETPTLRRRPQRRPTKRADRPPPGHKGVSRLCGAHRIQQPRPQLHPHSHDRSKPDGTCRHPRVGARDEEQRLPTLPPRERDLANPMAAAVVRELHPPPRRANRQMPELRQPNDVATTTTSTRSRGNGLSLWPRTGNGSGDDPVIGPPQHASRPRRRNGRTLRQPRGRLPRPVSVLRRLQNDRRTHPSHRIRPRRKPMVTAPPTFATARDQRARAHVDPGHLGASRQNLHRRWARIPSRCQRVAESWH